MFHDNLIRRNDLPRDAFVLIHDLCYDHEGRDRAGYRKRAQAILKADCDTASPAKLPPGFIKRTRIGKSDKAKTRAYLTKECDALTKKQIVAERGNACERCFKSGEVETPAAAHIKSKGHYGRLRFEKDNLLLLCYHCHIEGAHKECDDFLQWIEQKWPGRLERLRIMAATARRIDLKELAIVLRAETKNL
jgi:hypothetical protein